METIVVKEKMLLSGDHLNHDTLVEERVSSHWRKWIDFVAKNISLREQIDLL